jgi:hypothetical protein
MLDFQLLKIKLKKMMVKYSFKKPSMSGFYNSYANINN